MSQIILNSTGTSFSSQSIGDGFIKYIESHPNPSDYLDSSIEFVTSTAFLSSFGSTRIKQLIKSLIKKYSDNPDYSYSLGKLIQNIVRSPIFPRISDLIDNIPEELITQLDIDNQLFTTYSKADQTPPHFPTEEAKNTYSELVSKAPIVSLSGVFTEKGLNKPDSLKSPNFISDVFSPLLEQFQPVAVSDIADFISSLVSTNYSIEDKNININLQSTNVTTITSNSINLKEIIPSLLKPFKNQLKASIEDLISAFDRDLIFIHSQESFSLFINCLKSIKDTGTKNNPTIIPIGPFLGHWKHPLTQLNFLTHIVNAVGGSITFPKPAQIPLINLIIGSDDPKKYDMWRCPEFVDTLAYLYDFSESGVDQILQPLMTKGPALLLLVLALNPTVTKFATHLARLLLMSPTQYMTGFASLWAANEDFFIKLITALYEEQRSLLGRFLDLIDDLAIFDSFTSKCGLQMTILLNMIAFFRRSHNFQADLLKFYQVDKENTLNICFNIIENPTEYGFDFAHSTRRISETETVSADLIFFRFINEIYKELSPSLEERVSALFDICIDRSSDLTRYTFKWREMKEPPMSPKSPAPSKESDFIELATATDSKGIARYAIIVNSLISEFPKDKTSAQLNGKTLGKLLARDLLNLQCSAKALKLIEQGLHQRENSSARIFAISALEELKNNFDLILPFTKLLIQQGELQKASPEIHRAACEACKPPDPSIRMLFAYRNDRKMKKIGFFDQSNKEPNEIDNRSTMFQPKIEAFPPPPCLERFKYVHTSADRIKHETLSMTNKSNWDIFSLYYMKLLATPAKMQMTAEFVDNLIEAGIFLLYDHLNSPSCRTMKTRSYLTFLGKWLSVHTLQCKKIIPNRLLDIPKLLMFAYTNSVLCSVIPFICELLDKPSPIFNLPNPWTISILSLLSAIARIPYLNNSLFLAINKVFTVFDITIGDVEPYPIRRLKIEYITTSDFIYPPLDFSSSLSIVSAEGFLTGDIHSLYYVVHNHLVLPEKWELFRPELVHSITMFIYLKMGSISNTAAMTAFNLVLKDFARCKDPVVVDRHARALFHQFSSVLSLMSVSLLADPNGPSPGKDTEYRSIFRQTIKRNIHWLDQMVRQLAYHLGLQTLIQRLEPIQKLRATWNVDSNEDENGVTFQGNNISISKTNNSTVSLNLPSSSSINVSISQTDNGFVSEGSSGYWDVKSFPPSLAQRIPPALWPPEIEVSTSPYTRPVDPDSLVPTGILECFNVNADIRLAYSRFSLNSFALCVPEIFPNDLPFIPQLAQWIFSCFITDPNTGIITSIQSNKPMPNPTYDPLYVAATIVYCFPPGISEAQSRFGIELINQLLPNSRKELQGQIHHLLWNAMPDLTIFIHMVTVGLVAPNFFEVLAMKFIDSPTSRDVDISPLIPACVDLINRHIVYPSSIERLLSFLCLGTSSKMIQTLKLCNQLISQNQLLSPSQQQDRNQALVLADQISYLTKTWYSFKQFDGTVTPPLSHEQVDPSFISFFDNFEHLLNTMNHQSVQEYITIHKQSFSNDQFWEKFIIASFPDRRITLLKLFFAAIHFSNSPEDGHQILQFFLRGMFNTIRHKIISLDYFSNIISNIILQLRTSSINFAKIFGGFLTDTKPIISSMPPYISLNCHVQYPYPNKINYPQFMGAWLHIFPLVIQPLLLDSDVFPPTSGLVTVMLNIFTRFPINWGEYPHYRKCYKAILRIMLMIIHDAPRFVRVYCMEFVTAIPLHFRKLRNIILSCGITRKGEDQGDDILIQKKTNQKRKDTFLCILQAIKSDVFVDYVREMCSREKERNYLPLLEIEQFFAFAARYAMLTDTDEAQAKIWTMIRYLLCGTKSLKDATTVIEALFDMLRYDCWQTHFFVQMIIMTFSIPIQIENINFSDIIFSILMMRSYKMEIVPFGVLLLQDKLQTREEYQKLLSIYEKGIQESK